MNFLRPIAKKLPPCRRGAASDLVLYGHDHDYERSHPVRGCNHNVGADVATGAVVDTLQPNPVVTSDPANATFDTSRGTIHLILGGGGTSAPLDVYGVDLANGKPQAKVFTRPNRPVPGSVAGTFVRHAADAVEDAIDAAKAASWAIFRRHGAFRF